MRIEVQAKIILTLVETAIEEAPELTVLAAERHLNALATFKSPACNTVGIRVHIDGSAPKVIK